MSACGLMEQSRGRRDDAGGFGATHLACRRNNTSSDTTFHSPFEVAYQRIARRRNLQRLADLFVEADADGSLLLSMDEFREALSLICTVS
mmetsp:Transcript_161871/g.519181  ORF Transcript_161871/g.519181 Transcript_161871/m.519181 type:complete len:90 (+) Transcript_161871:3-272(+)|eukprot:CAMPEP_0203947856 /NCGR_PEP_ID=MMETSP0359-20131031/82695_1 /ASSEMBLY_ACC=CAM_ASM_000338 /TAXON_ID=268821 /ORGANISM="Scrippsiella Hangoei, Strain SHTV-5" /LENGTH=89 /DNA_ID=CAMNT_0050879319 /DNA_START=35 /DNA_END=304 /DNA_ORIENTATION=+